MVPDFLRVERRGGKDTFDAPRDDRERGKQHGKGKAAHKRRGDTRIHGGLIIN